MAPDQPGLKRPLSPDPVGGAAEYPQAGPAQKKKGRKTNEGDDNEPAPEKREALFKKKCPKNITERVERVMTQRFFCVDRRRTGEISEVLSVLGSTGNVYKVTVNRLPSCSCPDATKGNKCKHVLFVLLKVPLSSNLYYQKALLTSELVSIFSQAPRAPLDVATERLRSLYKVATGQEAPAEGGSGGSVEKRLPEEGDSCPVCYEDFEEGKERGLVFCLSIKGCGNGLYDVCFQQWAAQKKPVTCVFCRAEWSAQPSGTAAAAGPSYSAEGYLNLADSVGISRERDTSTYYHGPQKGKSWDGGYGRYGRY